MNNTPYSPQASQYPYPQQQPEPKKKKNLPLIIVLCVIAAAAIAAGSFFIAMNVINNSRDEDDSEYVSEKKNKTKSKSTDDVDTSDTTETDNENESMYLYVSENYDRNDKKTLEYLTVLKDRNYKDSAALFSDLFDWKISLDYLNSDPNDTDGFEEPFSKHSKFFHFGFTVEGGIPDDSLDLKLAFVFLNKATGEERFIIDDWDLDKEYKEGKSSNISVSGGLVQYADDIEGCTVMRIVFYNAGTDDVISSREIEITDEYSVVITLAYLNTNKDDTATILNSISKYDSYLGLGFHFAGGDPKASYLIKEYFPDGRIYEARIPIAFADFNYDLSTVRPIKQPDIITEGVIKCEIYDADTGNLLFTHEIEVTDEKRADKVFNGELIFTYCNDNPKDKSTFKNKFSKYAPFLHIGYESSMENDSSGTVSLRYVLVYPDGNTENYSPFDYEYGGSFRYNFDTGLSDYSAGKFTIKYYDAASNELVGKFSFEITDEKPADSKYLNKVSATFINSDHDNQSATSDVKNGEYVHFGLKIDGAAPGDVLKYYINIEYPDGQFSHVYDTPSAKDDGTITIDRYWEKYTSGTGTMTIKIYDYDTYTLLATITTNVTE